MPRTLPSSGKNHQHDLKRLAGEDFRFPAILRPAGAHTGMGTRLCGSLAEVAAAMVGGKDHYLTEFVDFRSLDGVYRKFRFFAIGSALLLRHMLSSEGWMIHAKARQGLALGSPDFQAEEQGYFTDGIERHYPEAWRGLQRIRARIGLDYFGIDCHLARDGRAAKPVRESTYCPAEMRRNFSFSIFLM